MLDQLIDEQNPRHLATYTRNPAILKMIARKTNMLYPLDHSDELQYLARSMPYATNLDGAVYHEHRYGPEGLFTGDDPADQAFDATGLSLKYRFPVLSSIRNALIVIGEVGEK